MWTPWHNTPEAPSSLRLRPQEIGRQGKGETDHPWWRFWKKPLGEPLSATLRIQLILEHHVREEDAASLHMLRERGRYAGRKVTYFQVYDAVRLEAAGIALRHSSDLDPSRVLHSGHIEDDGGIYVRLAASATPS